MLLRDSARTSRGTALSPPGSRDSEPESTPAALGPSQTVEMDHNGERADRWNGSESLKYRTTSVTTSMACREGRDDIVRWPGHMHVRYVGYVVATLLFAELYTEYTE